MTNKRIFKEKGLDPALFTRPRKWIVYKTQGIIRCACIRTQKDLVYYTKHRQDIDAFVFVLAFNKSEAYWKGKVLLETSSSSLAS